MQNFTVIPSTDLLDASLDLLMSNDETALSNSAGTAFPTENIYQGMFCYRTDAPTASGGLYELVSIDPTSVWTLVRDFSKTVVHLEDVTSSFATQAAFGASGSGHSKGLVPDPGSTAGTTRFLNEAGTWVVVDPGRDAAKFKPTASSPASMTVQIAAGFFSYVKPGGTQVDVEVAAQSVILAAAPSSPNSRFDLIYIDPTTHVADKVTGTSATSPTVPALPAGKLLIAKVGVSSGVTVINSTDITDLRCVWDADVPGTRWCIGTGTGDAIVLAYKPTTISLFDGLELAFRMPNAANTTATPNITVDANTAVTVTKKGGTALVAGDLPANSEVRVRYNLTTNHFELINPGVTVPTIADGHLLGNVSGAAASASEVTLTAILDKALGTTRGMVMRRDATGWTAVALTSGKAAVHNGTDVVALTVSQPGQAVSQFTNDVGYKTSLIPTFGGVGDWFMLHLSGSSPFGDGGVYDLTAYGRGGNWQCKGAGVVYTDGVTDSNVIFFQRVS